MEVVVVGYEETGGTGRGPGFQAKVKMQYMTVSEELMLGSFTSMSLSQVGLV